MNKFVIALREGGIMEQPQIEYKNPQTIEAETRIQAEKIYNEVNKCDYFYGECVAEKVDGVITVLVEEFEWIKSLL